MENVTAQRFRWRGLKDDTPKKWKATYESEVRHRAWAFTGLYGESPSAQTLDIATQELHNAMQAATEAHIPKRKDSIHARPWWTPELTQAYDYLHDLRRSAQTFLNVVEEEATDTLALIKRTRNRLKRLTKAAKRKWISEELEKAAPDDIWAFTKWPKGIRQYPSPPSTPAKVYLLRCHTKTSATHFATHCSNPPHPSMLTLRTSYTLAQTTLRGNPSRTQRSVGQYSPQTNTRHQVPARSTMLPSGGHGPQTPSPYSS